MGNDVLRNANSKVVMFGGDLSWTDDYLPELRILLSENKTVEIYFPSSKYYHPPNYPADKRLAERIKLLTNIGAKIYLMDEDYHIRCIISDPDGIAEHDKTKILLSCRIKKNQNNMNKNRYTKELITYRQDQETCKMSIITYNLIKNHANLLQGKKNSVIFIVRQTESHT